MFEQTFIEPTPGTKKPMSLLASLALQIGILFVLISIPLFYTQGLPERLLKSLLVAPPVPRAALQKSDEPKRASTNAPPRLLNIRQLSIRTFIAVKPSSPPQFSSAPELGVPGGTGNGGDSTISSLIDTPVGATAPPLATTEPKNQPKQGPVRVGSGLVESNLIHKVVPTYPSLAKATRIQGAVEFTAIINKDGHIDNLQLVKGHPLLVEAAREAVLQWRYRPTILNGVPVEVITEITVNFTLSQ